MPPEGDGVSQPAHSVEMNRWRVYRFQTTDHESRSVRPAITGAISNPPGQFGILTPTRSAAPPPGGVTRAAVVFGQERFRPKSQSVPYTSKDAAPRLRSSTLA